jgi:tetratricopeptide (TPR) repeat protein
VDVSPFTSFSGAYLAGRAAEADNNLDQAIAYYKQGLEVDPDDKAMQQSLMLALISNGLFDEALPVAEKLKQVADVERFSRVALAVDAIRSKKFIEAENYLKLALTSDLDKLIAGVLTAWVKTGAGDPKAGMEYLGTLKGPEWYNLFLNVHKALIADYADLKPEAAAAYEETTIARSQADVAPEAYVRLLESYAGFLARTGDKAKALEVLNRVDEFNPLRPTTATLRADIAAGKPIPKVVPTVQDGAAEMLFDIATALNRGGGEAFVRLYLQMARALSPANDAVLVQLGGVSEQQGNLEEAIKFYGDVPDASPLRRIAELQMGLDLAELKRTDEAVKYLNDLLARDPDDIRAYLALGGVHAGAEDFASAAKVYDRAVEHVKNPQRSDWSLFYQRGIAYERLKQWPKAEPNFRKALDLFPDQPQVLNYLGYSWIDMNMNLDEGLEMIKKAVELRPSDGFIIDSLGWGYYRLGRFDEAVTELERAVALQPADPVLNDHLGDAYWRVGRKLEATFQWAHARDLKPDAPVLASVLEKLKHGMPELAAKSVASLAQGSTTDAPTTPAPGSPQAILAEPPTINGSTSPAAATPVPGVYKVGPGESLWSIAVEKLGSGQRYQEILDLNPSLQGNPNRIYPGFELRLP